MNTTISGTDLDVFPLCLGGNVFGWTLDEPQSFDVLDAYAAAGGNFIDTSDAYSMWVPGNAGGESEAILGNWMAKRGNRDRVVIATKVGIAPGREGLAPATIASARTADQLAELVAMVEVRLSAEELDRLGSVATTGRTS